jgi:hypothetical protein
MHRSGDRRAAAAAFAGAILALPLLAAGAGCAAGSAKAGPAPATVEGRAFAEFSTRFADLDLGMSRRDVEQRVGWTPERRGPGQLVWEMWDDGRAHRHVFWAQFTGGRLVATGSSADDESG